MIDTREPKNGDFATYVENLTRVRPVDTVGPVQRVDAVAAPGSVPTRREARERAAQAARVASAAIGSGLSNLPNLWGRSATKPGAATGQSPHASPPAATLKPNALISRLLARVAAFLFVGGLAMFVLSSADVPFASPELGLALIVLGVVAFNLARKLG